MKKLLPVLLVASLYLTPMYPVYAVTTATSSARPSVKPPREAMVDKAKEKVASKVAEVKGRMEDKKEEMSSKSAALRQKLAAFKDQKKAERVEKLADMLNEINKKRTEMMTKHLEKFGELLTKIEDRTNEAAAAGKQTDAVKTAISQARTSIQTAQTAVDAQAAKDYTIEATGEATIKSELTTKRDMLQSDLKSVHDKVVAARSSLGTVISTIMKILTADASPAASVQ